MKLAEFGAELDILGTPFAVISRETQPDIPNHMTLLIPVFGTLVPVDFFRAQYAGLIIFVFLDESRSLSYSFTSGDPTLSRSTKKIGHPCQRRARKGYRLLKVTSHYPLGCS